MGHWFESSLGYILTRKGGNVQASSHKMKERHIQLNGISGWVHINPREPTRSERRKREKKIPTNCQSAKYQKARCKVVHEEEKLLEAEKNNII